MVHNIKFLYFSRNLDLYWSP